MMEKVHVNLGPRSYDIEIGSGNLADVTKFCDAEQDDAHAVIITDTNVDELYSEPVADALQEAGAPAAGDGACHRPVQPHLADGLARVGGLVANQQRARDAGEPGDRAGRGGAPAAGEVPRTAVRAAQSHRVAALHRGHALLRRASLAIVSQRRAATVAVSVAWLAHVYTAMGAVTALFATLAVFGGRFRPAFLWLALATVIDTTDGWLARALRVKERLPFFDGAKLDDIVDYLTYVFVPVLLILEADLLPAAFGPAIGVAVLLGSAYGFSHTEAKVKSGDHFFTGFPSYWNIVALYLYVWRLPPAAAAAILLTLAVLVFVPLRYVYPSRTVTLRGLTLVLGAAWGLLVFWLMWSLPDAAEPWLSLSLVFPVYYTALSIWLHFTGPAK